MRDPTLYIPSHAGIWTNRKFQRVSRRLTSTLTLPPAIGELIVFACLHAFWHAVVNQCPDGVLRGWDVLDIASAAKWPGEAKPFVEALRAEGWLVWNKEEGDLECHEWEFYGGEGATIRAGNAERKRKERAKKRVLQLGTGSDTSQDSHADDRDGHSDIGGVSQGQAGGVAVTGGAVSHDVTLDRTLNGSDPDRTPSGTEPKGEDVGLTIVMPPLPGGLRDGGPKMPRTPRGATIVGLAEEQARPKTVDDFVKIHMTTLAQRFPNLVTNPVILREAVLARFTSFVKKSQHEGYEAARAGIFEWLEKAESMQAQKARFAAMNGKDGHVMKPSKPKPPEREIYKECLVVSEKRGATCPPDPDDAEAWRAWCISNAPVRGEAIARIKERP